MKLFNITIYRKIPTEKLYPGNVKGLPPTLNIELGKWWEIVITRSLVEDLYLPYRKGGPDYKSYIFKRPEFIKFIKGGNIIPFWYGYAYYDFGRDCAAYCPVPINFLVAGARWLGRKWWEFKQHPKRWQEFSREPYDASSAYEAIDRLHARYPGPTGTNYHFDLDIIFNTLQNLNTVRNK